MCGALAVATILFKCIHLLGVQWHSIGATVYLAAGADNALKKWAPKGTF